jgi:hypothetical protein
MENKSNSNKRKGEKCVQQHVVCSESHPFDFHFDPGSNGGVGVGELGAAARGRVCWLVECRSRHREHDVRGGRAIAV